MSRSELREHVFRMLFRIEFNSDAEMQEQESLYFELLDEVSEKEQEYILNKYKAIKEKVEEIKFRVPMGRKEGIKAHAERCGESVNAFLLRAVEETMERDCMNVDTK